MNPQAAMKYRELDIQTQRDFPSNMRTHGFGWLVRAGYITRESGVLPLGERTPKQIHPSIPVIANECETYFPISTGSIEIIHCPACKYAERKELARFKKSPFSQEEPLPLEKVLTPDCGTIESLANFLNIPKEKTAKALMYVRVADNRFVFVVARGDMTLSEAKLKSAVGETRLAMADEIANAGAAAGYASPIGLKDALIIADDLIPQSANLAAGANESGYHFKNTNYGRDYSAEIIADLVQAKAGDACVNCGGALESTAAILLSTPSEFYFENMLLALAETHHDEKGLTFPKSAAPFDVYLMHVPGKEIDTRAKADEICEAFQRAGIRVLFDDRDERAGVKFNDADLIGCPARVTVGERGLKENKVEVKTRKGGESFSVEVGNIIEAIEDLLDNMTP
ncbi:MAG: YbaK/EbsC family protein [Anaerolineales bacterium]|nr:YbaK/EbsC family protein [Anaerolineales bacterium]